MGERDHSITCEVCGLQRGGLNDYRCDCDRGVQHRVITDPAIGLTLTLGVGAGNKARISWSDGSCHVEAVALEAGHWIQTSDPAQLPPPAIVCRATALAVAARIKEKARPVWESLQIFMDGLPAAGSSEGADQSPKESTADG